MNNARIRALESGLNGSAKRVYAAVPMVEAWTPQQICADLARQQTPIERRIVDGCLAHLCELGLVRKPNHGQFQRIAPKVAAQRAEAEAEEITEQEEDMPNSKPAPVPAADDRLGSSGSMAAKIRSFGARVHAECNALATEVEEHALALEQSVAAATADSARLKQLQALLRGIEQPS